MKNYEVQLKAEKQVKDKNDCRFGYSKSSQMFIATVGAGLLIFSLIGLLIGHCTISSFEKYLLFIQFKDLKIFYLKLNKGNANEARLI